MTPTTATHCPYCAMQCGMNLQLQDGAWSVEGRADFPTNRGGLCRKGWTSIELLDHPERLTTPLLRDKKNGPLRAATWDESLTFIANGIQKITREDGAHKIGVFGGGGLTNEKAYQLGKFARVAVGTPNIDYNGRFCMASAAVAGNKAFGIDRGMPFPMTDIPLAQTILMIGSNVAETMPPIMQWFEEQKANGGSLIVADPRKTPTAQAATLHLQLTPGTDVTLANGLLHIALHDGLIDHDFIQARTNDWDKVRRAIAAYWPDRVERVTGISVKKLEQAAHLLGEVERAMILTARGAEQQSKGTENALAFINVALALGKAGKIGCGWGTVTGQGNGQGGREHGQKCDQLPGYRKINNPADRAHMAQVWSIPEHEIPGAGVSAYELLDTLGTADGAKALIVMGSNVAVSAPNAGHVQERLKALDLLVVADLFMSETAALADVILPSTQWAEESGTMTNLEGRVLLRQQAALPPEGVWSDLQILSELAAKLGRPQFASTSREVFAELRRASAGALADYSGISYERIEAEHGVFWPCPADTHPGTPRLFHDKFAHEDGRARFHAVTQRPATEAPDADFPLYLTTGRVTLHYQSGTQTRRSKTLREAVPEAFVEVHPALAFSLGIVDNEMVSIKSRRGSVQVRARFSINIRADTLFVPFHWGGAGCANLLTNPELDPLSKMPEFKACAARLEKIAPIAPLVVQQKVEAML